ncbi:MAG: Uma2 family endonuclease [Chloroflexi bacterium]|nr:Uma2 family endonuclease [Chloroflexota bacterium]
MAITKTRHTLADLLAMPLEDERIYEILGGELVVFSSPDEPHAAVVIGLVRFLLPAEDAGYGRVRTAPRAVAFDYAARGEAAVDVTHPDVFFVRDERRAILGRRCVEAAPDLVIEVLSPSTRHLDLPGGRKWAIYERYGVPYYWIADPEARTMTQYLWRDGRYGEPAVLQPGDLPTCPLFPGVVTDVAQIFAGIL